MREHKLQVQMGQARQEGICILASDIDGTLIHQCGSREKPEKDLQLVDRNSYVHNRALALLGLLQAQAVQVLFITSRRTSSYRMFEAYFRPDWAIVEDGALILDSTGAPDVAWHERLYLHALGGDEDNLWQVAKEMHYIGQRSGVWRVDTAGYVASFKISFTTDRRQIVARDPREAIRCLGFELPSWLRVSFNSKLNSCIVAPGGAGKAAALMYCLETRGVGLEKVAAFGDDSNDLEMLAVAGLPITIGSARPEVRKAVQKKGGWVIQDVDHAGTIEVLARLLRCVGSSVGV